MKLKMAQLVEMTGVPKSTILYYIKEGLLPQPEKIKQTIIRNDAGKELPIVNIIFEMKDFLEEKMYQYFEG